MSAVMQATPRFFAEDIYFCVNISYPKRHGVLKYTFLGLFQNAMVELNHFRSQKIAIIYALLLERHVFSLWGKKYFHARVDLRQRNVHRGLPEGVPMH